MNINLFLFKLSIRNLLREPKRSLIMISSLAVGSAFIIWILNFSESGSKEVMRDFLSQYAGSYHITHNDFYTDKDAKKFSIFKTISYNDIPENERQKSIQRVVTPAFISGKNKTLGLLLTGTSPDLENKLSKLSTAIAEGSFLHTDSDKQLIIGKSFANKIDVKIGDEVAVIAQAIDGSVANDIFTVTGLLNFGGGDLEDILGFTTLQTAQNFLSIDKNHFHQNVNFDMDKDFPIYKDVKVIDWHTSIPEISVSIRFIDGFTKIVCVIIVIVISLGLSNTLLISFLERKKEFETLGIIGANSRWIISGLFIEVLTLGTIAIFLGIILGFLFTMLNYYIPINVELFTNGKQMYLGGMVIKPLVKIYPVWKYFWQVPLLVYSFIFISMILPSYKILKRGKHAI